MMMSIGGFVITNAIEYSQSDFMPLKYILASHTYQHHHKTLPCLIIMVQGVSNASKPEYTGHPDHNLHHLHRNHEDHPHHRHEDDNDGGGMSKRSLLSFGRNAIIDTWSAPNLSHSNTLHCTQTPNQRNTVLWYSDGSTYYCTDCAIQQCTLLEEGREGLSWRRDVR